MKLLEERFQKFFDAIEEKYPQFLPQISIEEVGALYAQGYALYQKEHYAQAIEIFRLLVTHDPLEMKHWFSLAACLQQEKQYELALQAWAMASLIKTENAEPHFHAAECYFSLNHPKEAALALAEAKARAKKSDPLRQKIEALQECWK